MDKTELPRCRTAAKLDKTELSLVRAPAMDKTELQRGRAAAMVDKTELPLDKAVAVERRVKNYDNHDCFLMLNISRLSVCSSCML